MKCAVEATKQLEVKGKQRTQELQLLGLTSDQYAAQSDTFVEDPETWPAVDFLDICN